MKITLGSYYLVQQLKNSVAQELDVHEVVYITEIYDRRWVSANVIHDISGYRSIEPGNWHYDLESITTNSVVKNKDYYFKEITKEKNPEYFL